MRIYVAGDSFAWGSFAPDFPVNIANGKDPLVHYGLTQLLCENGHNAKTVGRAGATLWQSVEKFEEHLVTNAQTKLDFVIWFVTDTFRGPDAWPKNLEMTMPNIRTQHRQKIREFCQHLDKYGIPIKLIGGLSTLIDKDVEGLYNVTIASHNMFKTIAPEVQVPEICHSGLVTHAKEVNTEVVEFLESNEKIWNELMTTPYLGNEINPTDPHPSPLAWEKLYDFLAIPPGGERVDHFQVDISSPEYLAARERIRSEYIRNNNF